jgi:hypothetical protein
VSSVKLTFEEILKRSRQERVELINKWQRLDEPYVIYPLVQGEMYVLINPGFGDVANTICVLIDTPRSLHNHQVLTLLKQDGLIRNYHWTRVLPHSMVHDIKFIQESAGALTRAV